MGSPSACLRSRASSDLPCGARALARGCGGLAPDAALTLLERETGAERSTRRSARERARMLRARRTPTGHPPSRRARTGGELTLVAADQLKQQVRERLDASEQR